MPIQFIVPVPGTSEMLPGEFTDEEWARLLAFHAEWERLRKAEWIVNGMPAQVNVKWDAGVGMTLTTPDKPTDAQVHEVLYNMRPFILNDEPYFVPKTFNIFARAIRHPWMRALKKREHGRFVCADLERMFKLTANDLQLNSEHTFNLWLNAFEYHRDHAKQARDAARPGRELPDPDQGEATGLTGT